MKKCPKCGHENKDGAATCAECGAALAKAKEEDLNEGVLLEGDDLAPCIEAEPQIIVPKKGPLWEHLGGDEYRGKFAVIRPCISRGRSIRGYQPIYEGQMLAEHASVFKGWPMYSDHLSEQLAEAFMEALQEKGRSIKDLGGRLAETWYDPDLVMEGDDDAGYRKGGVVGWVHPQPWVREMLNADRQVLHTSINAWPTKVKVGRASWDTAKKGAVIEGIRAKPMGSVDFVFRGGAGGRPLAVSEEDRQLAVSVLESAYPSPRRNPKETNVKKLSEMSAAEIKALPQAKLVELLKEEGGESVAESVAEAIALGVTGNGGSTVLPEGAALTAESLAEALTEQERRLNDRFDKRLKEDRESRDGELEERDEARDLEGVAHATLAEAHTNGFPQAWVDQLTPRYTVTAQGIGTGLKLAESDLTDGEGQKLDPKTAMKEKVRADIEESIKLIEAGGGKPRVKGFGQTVKDPQGSGGDGGSDGERGGKDKQKPLVREAGDNAWLDFLHESGDLTGDTAKDHERLAEVAGGGSH